MPEYESCSWEQATHVANTDRSIVRKVKPYTVCNHLNALVIAGNSHPTLISHLITLGFEPVKVKKVEWKMMRCCSPDKRCGISVYKGIKQIEAYDNCSIDLAEKICKLLNEEDK